MLTLPIVVGKSYRRRDGVVVVAKESKATCEDYLFVGNPEETDSANFAANKITGKIWGKIESPNDLIADAEEKPAGHPHAALMMLYAKDAAECSEPWKLWQHSGFEGLNWFDCDSSPYWDLKNQYRRKPCTIKIGDCEIQAPERVAPAMGSPYWVAAVSYRKDFSEKFEWENDGWDNDFLKRGFVHLTPEAAEAHARALIALTAIK